MFSKFQCMFSNSHDDILLSGLTLVTVVFLVVFDIPSIETHPVFNHGRQINYECIKCSNK